MDRPTYLRRLRGLALLGACLGSASLPAQTTDNEDVKASIEAMEARHREEIQALKKRLTEIDLRAWNSANKIRQALQEEGNKLRIHGFLSAYAVKADKDVDHSAAGYEDKTSFNPDTRFGLQFDYSVNQDIDAVLQLTAKGYENNDYDTRAEWAFLRARISEHWMLRAGRMRVPNYIYSETKDVGFSYPWARPPLESYLIGFENYNGLNSTYTIDSGDWTHEIQLFTGSNNERVQAADVEIRNQRGIAWIASTGDWMLRASTVDVGQVDIKASGFEESDIPANYSSLGMRYDDGTWLGVLEAVSYRPLEAAPILGHNSVNLMLARRIDRWMPYVSLGYLDTDSDQEEKILEYFSDTIREQLRDNVYQQTYDQVFASTEGGFDVAKATAESVATAVSNQAVQQYDATMAMNQEAMLYGVTLNVFGQPVEIPGQYIMAKMRSTTVGVRYDVLPNTALKLESAYYYGMEDTGGNWGYREMFEETRDALDNHQHLVSIGVDVVF